MKKLFLLTIFAVHASQKEYIDRFVAAVPCNEAAARDLYAMVNCHDDVCRTAVPTGSIPLFAAYPSLREHVAYIALGNLPTPITACIKLSQDLGVKLYVKRDDLSGKLLANGRRLFGGNKARKLEFVLADAVNKGAQSVMTFGCIGSNHALATATYARELGLRCLLLLKPQPLSRVVYRNLLLDYDAGAELVMSPTNNLRAVAAMHVFFDEQQTRGSFPYVIPTGASTPLGALGYVNAAFELKEQINAGVMPAPDRIYLPIGSAGTASGLLVGLKAAGIKSKIYAVGVEPDDFMQKTVQLVTQTQALLEACDQTFPHYEFDPADIEINMDFTGPDYAIFTPEAVQATKLMRETEHLKLDGVYSGKAFAAMLHNIARHECDDQTVLFWLTFCGDDFNDVMQATDYRRLPKPLHCFFETEVQELDRS